MYKQDRDFWWFTKRPGYMLYMLREGTGILMLLYIVEVIYHGLTKTPFHPAELWLGLIGALGHTLSWLWLSVLMPPLELKLWQKTGIFALFIGAWLVLSYFLLTYVYIS
ncbi:hypothetical protein COV82_06260 [Candidatus Peregrinibacteria bacterium CG11_big_fil_rev_8_21_14_0_20_46_8]|nr:MAG: hypothetical protein COV82_06260 [Candidatus Peregrinibacteria bacterium CG11_big_fil_rev_8_21_14_0_20_46_8]